MLDWSQIRELIWQARRDGLVMIFDALVTNVTTHWWFGPLLLVILLTLTGKAWFKLLRYLGGTFARGYSGN